MSISSRVIKGSEFFGKEPFVNTVGQHTTENKISQYIKSQEKILST